MDRKLLISGFLILGFAIACGVMASKGYRDPIGVGFLMFFTFVAGVVFSTALMGEQETSTRESVGKDAESQDEGRI